MELVYDETHVAGPHAPIPFFAKPPFECQHGRAQVEAVTIVQYPSYGVERAVHWRCTADVHAGVTYHPYKATGEEIKQWHLRSTVER